MLYNNYCFLLLFYCRALDLPSRAIRFSHTKLQNYKKKIYTPFGQKCMDRRIDKTQKKNTHIGYFSLFRRKKISHGGKNSLSLQPLGGNRSSHLFCDSGVPFPVPFCTSIKMACDIYFFYMGGLWDSFSFFPPIFFLILLLSLMIFTRRWTREQQQYSMLQRSRQLRDMGSFNTLVRFLKLYGTLCTPFPPFFLLLFFFFFLLLHFPPLLLYAPFILYLECKIYYYELFSYSFYLISQRKT